MQSLLKDPKWLHKNSVDASKTVAVNASNSKLMDIQVGRGKSTAVYDAMKPAPLVPAIGVAAVEVDSGMIVDVVIQNRPASEGNGEYRRGVTRSGSEQHPFHMHGHKFWVMGYGMGVFDPVADHDGLNHYNPMLRDTVTLPPGAWVVLRFRANNPGIWPLHCHIMWHHFMGQQVLFLEGRSDWAAPPDKMPKCASKCTYNFGPFTTKWVRSKFSTKKYEAP